MPPQPGSGREVVPCSIDELMELLGRRHHFQILMALRDEPTSVNGLAQRLNANVTSISRELRVLREAGLVDFDIDKKVHIYRLTSACVSTGSNGVLWRIRTQDGNVLEMRRPIGVTIDTEPFETRRPDLKARSTRGRSQP